MYCSCFAGFYDGCVCLRVVEEKQALLITLRIGFHIDECPAGDECVREKNISDIRMMRTMPAF